VLFEALAALDHYLPTDVLSTVHEAAGSAELGEAAAVFLCLLPGWQLNSGKWASVDEASQRSYVSALFFVNLALAQPPSHPTPRGKPWDGRWRLPKRLQSARLVARPWRL